MSTLIPTPCQRRLRLAQDQASQAETLLATLPGVQNVTVTDGRLDVHYDLSQIELAAIIDAAGQAGLTFSPRRSDRWLRLLQCWRDQNRHRQLLTPAGWRQYLQNAYLAMQPRLAPIQTGLNQATHDGQ